MKNKYLFSFIWVCLITLSSNIHSFYSVPREVTRTKSLLDTLQEEMIEAIKKTRSLVKDVARIQALIAENQINEGFDGKSFALNLQNGANVFRKDLTLLSKKINELSKRLQTIHDPNSSKEDDDYKEEAKHFELRLQASDSHRTNNYY